MTGGTGAEQAAPRTYAVSISEGLALKTSLQILYDPQPANLSVPLFDTGGTQLGTVGTVGDKVDSVATLTLVIKL